MQYLSRIEISKSALLSNINFFRSILAKDTFIMAIIKGNAYGHGLKEISSIIRQANIDWLGVNSLEEAIVAQEQNKNKPILIMGYTPKRNLEALVENEFRQVVYDIESIKNIENIAKKLNKKARVHLKIETGTNRQGVRVEDLKDFIDFFTKSSLISLEGIYTHFADVEESGGDFAAIQLAKFRNALQVLEEKNINISICHTASTAAILLIPKSHFNLIRLGIGLYGLYPANETKAKYLGAGKGIDLKPVLTWKTIVAQIKKIKKGETVGYGLSERISKDSILAVVPQGYADGYDRKLSSCGEVLIQGKRAKVLGRICMNMFMVDITSIKEVKVEDEVVLIGEQKDEKITAEELAEKVGTINYEIISRINPLIPRIIVE